MIKPRTGDIGRRVVYRMKEVGQERQGVLLNMEPANDPTQVKVSYTTMSGRRLGSRVTCWIGQTDPISFEVVCGLDSREGRGPG